jgi:flagellar motor switch protein FliM
MATLDTPSAEKADASPAAAPTPAADAPSTAITPDEPGGSQPFRFSAASAISSTRQESLVGWHRNFLRTASGTLTDLLRVDVKVEMDAIEVLSCAQLIAGRGDDNHGLLFRLPEQPGNWLLDLPVPLSLLVVERMMGGSGALAADKARDLTEIEQIIFQQFATTLLADYTRNWQADGEPATEIVRQARHFKQARALGHQPADLLLRVALRIVFKEATSNLWIVMPIAATEDILLRAGAGEDSPSREKMPGLATDRNSPIGSVPVAVSLRWQGFDITLREVESLAPGDLLLLDNKKCENAVVWLGDRARFAGRITREPHKTTVTIAQPLE